MTILDHCFITISSVLKQLLVLDPTLQKRLPPISVLCESIIITLGEQKFQQARFCLNNVCIIWQLAYVWEDSGFSCLGIEWSASGVQELAGSVTPAWFPTNHRWEGMRWELVIYSLHPLTAHLAEAPQYRLQTACVFLSSAASSIPLVEHFDFDQVQPSDFILRLPIVLTVNKRHVAT